jgi:hypothetical protein
MTEEEVKETIRIFKEEHMANLKKLMYHKGELIPMVCVLIHDTMVDKVAVVVAPVVGDFSETAKDTVVEKVIPQIFKRLKEEEKIPLCFSFSSEAWLRKMEGDVLPKNWKSLDKTEIMITTFETKTGSEIVCKTMHRIGQAINEEGELIERIELQDMDTKQAEVTGGRFVNIFKKFGF